QYEAQRVLTVTLQLDVRAVVDAARTPHVEQHHAVAKGVYRVVLRGAPCILTILQGRLRTASHTRRQILRGRQYLHGRRRHAPLDLHRREPGRVVVDNPDPRIVGQHTPRMLNDELARIGQALIVLG